MEAMNKSADVVTSTEAIYAAVLELHNAQQRVTRYSVAELTGLPMVQVDDRLKTLVERERIKRVLKGEYVPVKQFAPPRPISKTILEDGCVKYEIGDHVLALTPEEERRLASLTAGAALLVAQIETGRAVSEMATTMTTKVDRMERILELNPTRDVSADLLRASMTMERAALALQRMGKGADESPADLPGLDG